VREIRTCIPDIAGELAAVDGLLRETLAAQRDAALRVEAASMRAYLDGVTAAFDANGTLARDSVEQATRRRNRMPRAVVADGRAYVLVVDARAADVPGRFEMGTRLRVQGAGVLGSGRRDDGTRARFGTVTGFNESSSKYKVQYPDDFEWLSWPQAGTGSAAGPYRVEIDIYPEDVAVDVPGFRVSSRVVNLARAAPRTDAGLLLVTFAVTPRGPPFDAALFGPVPVSVVGVKSRKSLLDPAHPAVVEVAPPPFLLPARRYIVVDAVRNRVLPAAVAEFHHLESGERLVFRAAGPARPPPGDEGAARSGDGGAWGEAGDEAGGIDVTLAKDGLYSVCFRGQVAPASRAASVARR
jgi:hypothetical protein